MIEVSIVVAMMNEEESIKPLLNQIYTAMDSLSYELILVDDGSTDDTVSQVKSFANSQTKVVEFMKNYGQSTHSKRELTKRQVLTS